MKRLGVKFIDFTGGEPLLHKDLPAMLQKAKQLKFFTSVTTNCIRYIQLAEYIKGKVDYLHFSLDSLDATEHNKLRGQATFDLVMQSIERALELGERPDLLFTVTHSNYRAIDTLSRFAREKKLVLIVNPVFSHLNKHVLSVDILQYIESYQFKPYVYINHAFHKLIKAGGNDYRYPRCRAVSSAIVISPGNELLLPCFHFAEHAIPIDDDLFKIIRSGEYKKYKQQQGRFASCKHCTINCYFDPSFFYKLDSYFFLSLISKAKYGFDKYVRSRLNG